MGNDAVSNYKLSWRGRGRSARRTIASQARSIFAWVWVVLFVILRRRLRFRLRLLRLLFLA
jgi:hypothetical protein